MKSCKACSKPLEHREEESRYDFGRRNHCDRKCSLVTSIAKRRGQGCGTALLTERQVRLIKHELQSGASANTIAAAYGVSAGAINSIKYGHTWKHIV